MATKAWFNYSTYMNNKLAQMQELDPTYTMTKLKAAFEQAGFSGDEGAQAHFLKYGHTEDVSPNQYFSAEYYYQAKALQFYTSEAGGSIPEATVLANIDKYALDVEGLIKAAGMDAWTHYTKYGTAEGINPSANFNTAAYMQAKLDAMGSGWTEERLNQAFKDAGLNAVAHAMQYGTDPTTAKANEVACWTDTTHTKLADAYATNDDPITPDTDNVNFTVAQDTLVGTTGNDTFVATVDNAATSQLMDTFQSVDSADGGEGEDTLNVTYANTDGAGAVTPKISNIENVVFKALGAVAYNMSGTTGVKALTNDSSVANMTFSNVAALADVTVQNVSGNTTTIRYANSVLTGESDAQNLTLSGATKVHNVAVRSENGNEGVETLNVASTGSANSITYTGVADKLQNLVVTGDQALSLSLGAATEDNLESVDGSAATGALTLTLANLGSEELAVKTGSGDDVVYVTDPGNKKTYDLGAGEDTLAVTIATAALSRKVNAENTETVNVAFNAAATNTNLNMSGSTALTTVGVGAENVTAGTTTLALNKLSSTMKTLNLNGDGAKTAGDGLGTIAPVTLTYDSPADDQTLTVNITNTDDNGVLQNSNEDGLQLAAKVVADDVVNLVINSEQLHAATKAGQNGGVSFELEGDALQTIKVTSPTTVNFTGDSDGDGNTGVIASENLTSFDASGSEGSIVATFQELGVSDDASKVSIKTGSNDDTVSFGGAGGNGQIEANVTVETGAGDDEITLTATTAEAGERTLTIKAGAGDDTVDLAAHTTNLYKSVTVDLGDGADVLTLGQALLATAGKLTISGFDAGKKGDVLGLDTTGLAGANNFGKNNLTTNDVDAKVIVDTSNSLSDFTAASFLDAFVTNGALTVAAGDKFYVIAGDGSDAALFYVANDATAALIENEISLVGTISGIEDCNDLVEANFAIA